MELRNLAFRKGVLKSVSFDVPVISVGNLSVGGTGKTPMVKYLIQQYSGDKTIGVLSRGYGRLTKGFFEVETSSLAKNVGDEPLEIKIQFPELTVTVCENRVMGIPEMLAINPKIDLIILDDAFQHQYVKPKVSIVLSTFSNPYWSDYVLPMGKLREFRLNIKRADILIITKAPDLSQTVPETGLPTFLSQTFDHQDLSLVHGLEREILKPIVVSGLADNTQFQQLIGEKYPESINLGFADHRTYTITEVKQMIYDADRLDNNIITTEKDWVKLKTFVQELKPDVSFWVQPISLGFTEPFVLKTLIDDKING
ncbi:MAG: tetraacyldisaccharide 4'-kinase [bacterium]|jgi:tetraacyldisaccharide 4'-kinase